jgi:hypothetical protein
MYFDVIIIAVNRCYIFAGGAGMALTKTNDLLKLNQFMKDCNIKAKDMADAIHNNIEKDRVVDESIEKAAKVCYETKGPGFADVYGTDAVFESDPIKLQKKIKRCSKNALEKYERFNLDGTLQSNYKPHKKHWKKK